jgi:transposase-like protein
MATRRQYDNDTKDLAAEAYLLTGSPTEVGRAMDIPSSTVMDWGRREKMETEKGIEEGSKNAALLKDERMKKKLAIVEKGYSLASHLLDLLHKTASEAKFKDIAIGFGIIMEKTLLASGEATARTETGKTVSREDMLDAAREALDEKIGKGKGKTA